MINNKNLYLFNLVNDEISVRTIKNLVIQLDEREFSFEIMYEIIGKRDKANSILNYIDNVDKKNISTYALSLADISYIVMEKIVNEVKNLENLYDNLDSISEELRLQERVIVAIEKFCKSVYNKPKKIDNEKLSDKILNIFSSSQKGLTVAQVWKELQSLGEIVNFQEVSKVISDFYNNNKLTVDHYGYVIKLSSLLDEINLLNEYDKEIMTMRIKGFTLQNIADKFLITKERVRQKIKAIISKMPIVDGELYYSKVFKKYNLSKYARNLLFRDKTDFSEELYSYIEIKYETGANTDRDIDFLNDKELLNTPNGKKILESKKKFLYKNNVYDIDFLNVFRLFLDEKELVRFSPKDIYKEFINYANERNIDLDFNPLADVNVSNRKLDNSSSFVNCKGNYLYLEKIELDEEIKDIFNSFLSSIEGRVSTQLLINDHPEVIKRNNLNDKFEIHGLLKRLFAPMYPNIKFGRTPHIEQLNFDEEKYIESLIELCQPMDVSEFIEVVYDLTGIDKGTFSASASKVINKYTHNNRIEMVPYVLSQEERDFLKSILGNHFILVSVLERKIKESRFKDKVSLLTRNSVLMELSFKRNGNLFLNNEYRNAYIAFDCWLNDLPKIIEKFELFQFMDEPYLKYRLNNFFTGLDIIWLDDIQIINVRKTLDIDKLIEFRDRIVSLIDYNEIFTIHYLRKNETINKVFEDNKDIASFGDKFITNILITHPDIYNNKGDVVIMRKGASIVKNNLVQKFVEEHGSISSFDLSNKINLMYGISPDISRKTIEDLGYYMSFGTEEIYLTKEMYKKKVREFLDE